MDFDLFKRMLHKRIVYLINKIGLWSFYFSVGYVCLRTYFYWFIVDDIKIFAPIDINIIQWSFNIFFWALVATYFEYNDKSAREKHQINKEVGEI